MTQLVRTALCVCLFVGTTGISSGQGYIMDFLHPGEKAGLEEESIWTVYEDKKGFMWFGSFHSGLIRFDGNDFKIYVNDQDDTTSLSDNWVTKIYEDSKGNFWVGTRSGGLNLFLPDLERFYHFKADQSDPEALSNNLIRDLLEDQEGNLWVATDDGLNRIRLTDILSKPSFVQYRNEVNNEQSLANNSLTRLLMDSRGHLWMGTYGGLHRYDPQHDHFIRYPVRNGQTDGLSHPLVRALHEDSQGNLWIGTFGNGLNRLNPHTNQFTHYTSTPGDPASLPSNLIWSIETDAHDNLWIGTEDHGLVYFDYKKGAFRSFVSDPVNNKTISSNQVFSVFKSSKGDLWVGTWGGGINLLSAGRKRFRNYLPSSESNSLSYHVVTSLFVRKNGKVLVGTEGGGLNVYDPDDETFNSFKHDPTDPNTIRSNEIATIFEDRSGFVWVGTRGAGVSVLTPDLTRIHLQLNYQPGAARSLGSHTVRSFYEDSNGLVWIGTDNGLDVFDKAKNKLDHYSAGVHVTCIASFDQQTLWIGTRLGLSLFDVQTREFRDYGDQQPSLQNIGNAWVSRIQQDSSGNVWIGTSEGFYKYVERTDLLINTFELGTSVFTEDDHGNFWLIANGLTRYSIKSGETAFFNESDDLPSTNLSTCVKLQSGEIIAGSLNGLIRFDPKEILRDSTLPEVRITNFYLFNEPAKVKVPGFNDQKEILTAREIILDYDQSVFSIGFSALQFTHPEKCQYAYKLEGFDEDWIFTDSDRRIATFTNLDPGQYKFQVKATNHDGIWNENATDLGIIITPPFWKTWWAYSLYILLVVFMVYFLRRYEMQRIHVKHQFELTSLEATRLQEVDELKSRFFINISHEFRTPLTLIIAPLVNVLNTFRENDEVRQTMGIALKNARRLQELINQVLDLSRLEQKKLRLRLIRQDIIAFLKPRIASFSSLAESREIDFHVQFHSQHLIMLFDDDKLEKIINNLISNSIKFTNPGGRITIRTFEKEDTFRLSVSDTGVGISPEFQDKIFDRFYQVENEKSPLQSSSGIGLALVKELVELHHGSVELTSEPAKGTEFQIMFPLREETYNTEFIADDQPLPFGSDEPLHHPEIQVSESTYDSPVKGLVVLVIEDNNELRDFIRKEISLYQPEHILLTASDGVQGYELAKDQVPDLIVTDWMMPGFTGIDLCEKLKKDEHTSHIPIIMLTARADMDSKIHGLEQGADAYISKPFESRELIASIKNLLAERARLHDKFRRNMFQYDLSDLTSVDERFMHKVKTQIETNLSNPDLNVYSLSKEIGMSRSQLFRKFKVLTGLSPNEFIRAYRLEKAYVLLEKKYGNISEVAYSTGFGNLSYFTKCFYKQFHKLPSDIRDY